MKLLLCLSYVTIIYLPILIYQITEKKSCQLYIQSNPSYKNTYNLYDNN